MKFLAWIREKLIVIGETKNLQESKTKQTISSEVEIASQMHK